MAWLDVLQSLTPLVIGSGLLYVAYQQHKTNRDKLKLDLYDRRLRVFHGVLTLLGNIAVKGRADLKDIQIFTRETAEVYFLFSKDIPLQDHLEEIRLKANELWATHATLEGVPVGDQRNQIVGQQTELLRWLIGQFDVTRQKFKPYLGFK